MVLRSQSSDEHGVDLEALVDSFPGALWEVHVDLPEGKPRLVFVSARAPEILGGLTVAELMADVSRVDALLAEEDRDARARIIAATIRHPDGEHTFDFRLRRPDGTWRWVRNTVTTRRRDEHTLIAYGNTQDVDTEKVLQADMERAKLQAEASEARLRNISDAAPIVLWQAHIRADVDVLSIDYMSAPGVEFYAPNSVEGMMAGTQHAPETVHPDDRSFYAEAVRRARAEPGETKFYAEYRTRRRDGAYRWSRVFGNVLLDAAGAKVIYGCTVDIHEERTLHEELVGAEKRARDAARLIAGLADALPLVLWETRFGGPFGAAKCVYISARVSELFAPYTAPDILADMSRLHEATHPDDRGAMREALLAAQEPNTDRVGAEYRTRRANGEYRWARAVGSVRALDDGSSVLYGYTVDIHEEKLAEAEMARARDAAEEAVRAKAVFLSTMSHEMRTPLNAVLGFAELIRDTELSAPQRQFVTSIRGSGEHLLGVINDVLDFSKIESGAMQLERETIAISPVIEAALDIVAPRAATQRLSVAYVVDEGVPPGLVGDEGRLRQILVNLLSNAVKFTKVGKVLVRVGARPLADGGTTMFTFAVEDTGVGIAPERMNRLFRDFSQVHDSTTREYGGSGLGLAISARLVALMGGSIDVVSEVGKGSTFTVSVPAEHVLVLPPRSSDGEPPSSPDVDLGRRILLVEDNPVNELVAVSFLRKLGYEPHAVRDGASALAAVVAAPYDIVLLDIEMPGMDGYETARELRRHFPQGSLYIIAMTAHALPEHRELCRAAGMNDFLPKPVDRRRLAELIRAIPIRERKLRSRVNLNGFGPTST